MCQSFLLGETRAPGLLTGTTGSLRTSPRFQQSLPLGTRLVASTLRRGRSVPSHRRLSCANEEPHLPAGWLSSPCRGQEGSLSPEGTQCQRHVPLKHLGGNPSWPPGPVKVAAAARGHQRDSEAELTAQPSSGPGPVVPTSSAPSTPSSWVRAALDGALSFPGLSLTSAISLHKAGHGRHRLTAPPGSNASGDKAPDKPRCGE